MHNKGIAPVIALVLAAVTAITGIALYTFTKSNDRISTNSRASAPAGYSLYPQPYGTTKILPWTNNGPTVSWTNPLNNETAICNGKICWVQNTNDYTWKNNGAAFDMSVDWATAVQTAPDGTQLWTVDKPKTAFISWWETGQPIVVMTNGKWMWKYVIPGGVPSAGKTALPAGWRENGKAYDLSTAWAAMPKLPGSTAVPAAAGFTTAHEDLKNKTYWIMQGKYAWSVNGSGAWVGPVDVSTAGNIWTTAKPFTKSNGTVVRLTDGPDTSWTDMVRGIVTFCRQGICWKFDRNANGGVGAFMQDGVGIDLAKQWSAPLTPTLVPTKTPTPTLVSPLKPTPTPAPVTPPVSYSRYPQPFYAGTAIIYPWSNNGPTASWTNPVNNETAVCNGKVCWIQNTNDYTWKNNGNAFDMAKDWATAVKAATDGTLPWTNNGPQSAFITWFSGSPVVTLTNGKWYWHYVIPPGNTTLPAGWRENGKAYDLSTAWAAMPKLPGGTSTPALNGLTTGHEDLKNKTYWIMQGKYAWSYDTTSSPAKWVGPIDITAPGSIWLTAQPFTKANGTVVRIADGPSTSWTDMVRGIATFCRQGVCWKFDRNLNNGTGGFMDSGKGIDLSVQWSAPTITNIPLPPPVTPLKLTNIFITQGTLYPTSQVKLNYQLLKGYKNIKTVVSGGGTKTAITPVCTSVTEAEEYCTSTFTTNTVGTYEASVDAQDSALRTVTATLGKFAIVAKPVTIAPTIPTTPIPTIPNAARVSLIVSLPDLPSTVPAVKGQAIVSTPGINGSLPKEYPQNIQFVRGTDGLFRVSADSPIQVPVAQTVTGAKMVLRVGSSTTLMVQGLTLTPGQTKTISNQIVLYMGDLVNTMTNDTAIDSADIALFVQEYSKTLLPGVTPIPVSSLYDLNLNGKIDIGDFAIVARNYTKKGVSLVNP